MTDAIRRSTCSAGKYGDKGLHFSSWSIAGVAAPQGASGPLQKARLSTPMYGIGEHAAVNGSPAQRSPAERVSKASRLPEGGSV